MGSVANSSPSEVVLASSFYTGSLEQPFAQALERQEELHSVVCVPYNQLHTFLLDPRAVIREQVPAHVILLMRVEDLIRLELAGHKKNDAASESFCLRVFRERTEQFLEVVKRISGLRLAVLICPSSQGAHDIGFLGNAVRVAEYKIAAELRNQQRHRVFLWSDFERATHATAVFNAAGDRLGHVPFSPEGLEILAEFFVAQLGALPATNLKPQSYPNDNFSLRQFLSGLKVELYLTPLTPEDEETALALIRHTTHFITTPDRKWMSGELSALASEAASGEGWIVRVRDRFGDYDVSGTMVFAFEGETMRVGFWFLTCPILGKQVEYALMSWMAQVAEMHHAQTIELPFVKGRDNQVLYSFLASLAEEPNATLASRAQRVFRVPVSGLRERVLQVSPDASAVKDMLARLRVSNLNVSVSA